MIFVFTMVTQFNRRNFHDATKYRYTNIEIWKIWKMGDRNTQSKKKYNAPEIMVEGFRLDERYDSYSSFFKFPINMRNVNSVFYGIFLHWTKNLGDVAQWQWQGWLAATPDSPKMTLKKLPLLEVKTFSWWAFSNLI